MTPEGLYQVITIYYGKKKLFHESFRDFQRLSYSVCPGLLADVTPHLGRDLCRVGITDAYRRFRCDKSGPDFEVPTVSRHHVYVGAMFAHN